MPKRPSRRFNTSMAQPLEGGGWKLRVWSRSKVGKQSPRLTIRCGCCTNGFQIYHDKEGLEIGGVAKHPASAIVLRFPINGALTLEFCDLQLQLPNLESGFHDDDYQPRNGT
jgi:hypothetical protein